MRCRHAGSGGWHGHSLAHTPVTTSTNLSQVERLRGGEAVRETEEARDHGARATVAFAALNVQVLAFTSTVRGEGS